MDGRNIAVEVQARRLLKKMPHAQHIHFGKAARNECPTVRDDDNADHRVNTVEGQPAYGPVRVSLTTKGDTSPKSTLAVNRFPKAPKGKVNYERRGILKPVQPAEEDPSDPPLPLSLDVQKGGQHADHNHQH